MFMRHVLLSLSFWASAVSATPLQSTDEQTIGVSTALNRTGLDLLVPSNASAEDPDASNVGGLLIQCDGEKYGFNPSLADCEGARSYIAPDSEQYTFGERHTGFSEEVFPLPYMIMGDKAECFFKTIIIGDGPTGRASLNQVRTAASALLLRCASNEPSQGGIATRIGGDNNMAVIMSVFKPNVQCRGDFQTAGSCKDVLADMPASNELEVFGPQDARFVKEVVPQEIVSEDGGCMLKLYSTGRSDLLAWYQIWEATEATFAMCGRFLQGGSYRGIGLQGNIFITLGAGTLTASMGNSSDEAIA